MALLERKSLPERIAARIAKLEAAKAKLEAAKAEAIRREAGATGKRVQPLPQCKPTPMDYYAKRLVLGRNMTTHD